MFKRYSAVLANAMNGCASGRAAVANAHDAMVRSTGLNSPMRYSANLANILNRFISC